MIYIFRNKQEFEQYMKLGGTQMLMATLVAYRKDESDEFHVVKNRWNGMTSANGDWLLTLVGRCLEPKQIVVEKLSQNPATALRQMIESSWPRSMIAPEFYEGIKEWEQYCQQPVQDDAGDN
jgi:hypothetical protein